MNYFTKAYLFVVFALICGKNVPKRMFSPDEIKHQMKSGGVVSDVIDVSPSANVDVEYDGGKRVAFGGELTPSDVKEEPKVAWAADPAKFYTLAMVDPDAPSRADPKFREVKHWLVVNIEGCDVAGGDVVAEYLGSGPPKDTGLHRYIFLVYEQPNGRIDFVDEPRSLKLSRAHRFNFSIRTFAKQYELGNAFAGNYFQAQWDPYVEERNKFITNN